MNDSRGSGGVWNSVTDWWAHPFTSGGSAFRWTLFVGLILVAVMLWQLVLIQLVRHLEEV
jgi:hypothetical protein